jgi:predicted 2-oxoglutarate/Fe(II)-dependent dioxygenase YbiX
MNRNLIKNNYIVIPNFIESRIAKQLAHEFKDHCETHNLDGDSQAPLSNSKYNYISFLELLCEKTSEVSSILEETVLPTYAYSRVYHKESILKEHTDRDSCEISLTVHLDGDDDWEIFIETPNGEKKSVNLRPGDAMMYLGRDAKHWRNEYTGNYYTQVFLHYVRSRGDCSYSYFDKNQTNKDAENTQDNQKIENSNPNILENEKNIMQEIEESKVEEDTNKTPTLLVPKSRKKLEDFVYVFDDIIPESLCNEIIQEYKNSNDWLDALIKDGPDRNVRNCDQIQISDQFIITKNENVRRSLDERIHENLRLAAQKYTEKNPYFFADIDTGYQLLRYQEGGFYKQHTDSFLHQQRSVSCSIQLNEDYDGGELALFDREMMIRTKTGSVIMFPSNFMYPHEIMPVINGTRYSIITWFV